MKQIGIFVFAIMLIVPSVVLAQGESEYNSEQLAMRTELFNFLKQEGFMPDIDKDGDIHFKSEGDNFYVSVSKTDNNPMYVTFFKSFNYPEDYSLETILLANKELSLYKGIKIVCFKNSLRIGAELFVRSAEPLKHSFYKLKGIINQVEGDFVDECEKVGNTSMSTSSSASVSEIPFLVTQLEVANTESNGTIIQDYGATIWSYKTKYLKPRITIKPIRSSGTVDVYVKLYKNGVLSTGSSSPSGYSYAAKVNLNGQSSQVISLDGWGSSNSGHWVSGDYRFEIWYGNYCIGSKSFKVN